MFIFTTFVGWVCYEKTNGYIYIPTYMRVFPFSGCLHLASDLLDQTWEMAPWFKGSLRLYVTGLRLDPMPLGSSNERKGQGLFRALNTQHAVLSRNFGVEKKWSPKHSPCSRSQVIDILNKVPQRLEDLFVSFNQQLWQPCGQGTTAYALLTCSNRQTLCCCFDLVAKILICLLRDFFKVK